MFALNPALMQSVKIICDCFYLTVYINIQALKLFTIFLIDVTDKSLAHHLIIVNMDVCFVCLSHCLSLSLAPGNPDWFWFYLSGTGSPR